MVKKHLLLEAQSKMELKRWFLDFLLNDLDGLSCVGLNGAFHENSLHKRCILSDLLHVSSHN